MIPTFIKAIILTYIITDIYIIICINDIVGKCNTSLITLGSEIRHQERMGRDTVLLFSIIG